MLGLVNYSSSDEEGNSEEAKSSRDPTAKLGGLRSKDAGPPVASPTQILPDAAALLGGHSLPHVPNTKRTVTQVSGVSVPPPRAAKAMKGSTMPTGKGGGRSAALLPPQLSGRKNIPTEDYAKMFTKQTLSGTGPKQAKKGPP
mmetsp:Transcript_38225/g.108029  ORF Transcript_38225/g.108029 Transcript_38225/m.108029 type:complete len:143 (-) Transcript_38225:1247-1675(-)